MATAVQLRVYGGRRAAGEPDLQSGGADLHRYGLIDPRCEVRFYRMKFSDFIFNQKSDLHRFAGNSTLFS